LQNPELFDPLKIGRYTVIHVWYEYPSQRGEEKYFIVLRHDKTSAGFICRCIKATSRIARFENDPDLLKGVVLYEQRTIPFFTERTVVDPDSKLDIDHSHLKDQSRKNRFRVAGKMPEDFHERLVKAIKDSDQLAPKIKRELLGFVGCNEDGEQASEN
jgi:hypothetical protein